MFLLGMDIRSVSSSPNLLMISAIDNTAPPSTTCLRVSLIRLSSRTSPSPCSGTVQSATSWSWSFELFAFSVDSAVRNKDTTASLSLIFKLESEFIQTEQGFTRLLKQRNKIGRVR